MIEVRIPIPIDEYFHVRDDLEAQFQKHRMVVTMSGDTVIRTWATLRFDEWFRRQDSYVDFHIGWGEFAWDGQEPEIAAVPHELVDEGCQPAVVMTFEDEACEFAEYDEETAAAAKSLALMFKLAWGGAA